MITGSLDDTEKSIKQILSKRKYAFINIENAEVDVNIDLPMEYKVTIYKNIQGLMTMKIFNKNDRVICRKTSKDIDSIIKIISDYIEE